MRRAAQEDPDIETLSGRQLGKKPKNDLSDNVGKTNQSHSVASTTAARSALLHFAVPMLDLNFSKTEMHFVLAALSLAVWAICANKLLALMKWPVSVCWALPHRRNEGCQRRTNPIGHVGNCQFSWLPRWSHGDDQSL